MKWRQTKDFPKASGSYLVDCSLNDIGRERFDIHSKMDEISWKTRNARWLDESPESEPLYTEKDMLEFAEWMFSWCKSYDRPGIYHTTDDQYVNREELLKLYLNTRIPATI
jgi:hypothetical protein